MGNLTYSQSVLKIDAGDPQRLFKGVDSHGNLCGINSPVEALGLKWEPHTDSSKGFQTPSEYGVCVSKCPLMKDVVDDPYSLYGSWVAISDTFEVLGYCLPLGQRPSDLAVVGMFADILRTIGVAAFVGFFLSSIFSLVFILLIRIPCMLRIMIWLCILVVFALGLAGGYALVEQAAIEKASDSMSNEEMYLLEVFGKVLIVFAVLWACVIFVMRERIALAVSLIKEASTALVDLPLLLLLPILQTVVMAVFTGVWLTYSVYLVSSAELITHVDDKTGNSYKQFMWSKKSQQCILFMFFCWAWTAAFIQALGHLIFSHAVLTWYFDSKSEQIQSTNLVLHSVWVSLRYHTGTAAFGSLLVALFSMLRACVEYVRVKSKVATANAPCTRRLLACIGCLMSCTLCCFDSFLKFINKQAYIQVSLSGSPFLPSARQAFGLVVRNVGRLAAITLVGDFVVWVGKVSIALSCAACSYMYVLKYQHAEVGGIMLPVLFSAWISYITASLYLSLISATANTMLHCFIAEEETQQNNQNSISLSSRRPVESDMPIPSIPRTQGSDDNSFTAAEVEMPPIPCQQIVKIKSEKPKNNPFETVSRNPFDESSCQYPADEQTHSTDLSLVVAGQTPSPFFNGQQYRNPRYAAAADRK